MMKKKELNELVAELKDICRALSADGIHHHLIKKWMPRSKG